MGGRWSILSKVIETEIHQEGKNINDYNHHESDESFVNESTLQELLQQILDSDILTESEFLVFIQSIITIFDLFCTL